MEQPQPQQVEQPQPQLQQQPLDRMNQQQQHSDVGEELKWMAAVAEQCCWMMVLLLLHSLWEPIADEEEQL